VIVEDLLCFVQKLKNGRISHRIEDALSFLPAFDDVAFAQNGQVLRKGTLLDPQPGAQFIDTYFSFSESIEDLDPHGVGKSFEELGGES
jgi:hypothetical protein